MTKKARHKAGADAARAAREAAQAALSDPITADALIPTIFEPTVEIPPPPQFTHSEIAPKLATMIIPPPPSATSPDDVLFCPECYLPLHPDPKPEKLYIFLHALRYTTSLGSFETEMPEWAAEGWGWDRN